MMNRHRDKTWEMPDTSRMMAINTALEPRVICDGHGLVYHWRTVDHRPFCHPSVAGPLAPLGEAIAAGFVECPRCHSTRLRK